jgi:hypothetical protein
MVVNGADLRATEGSSSLVEVKAASYADAAMTRQALAT